MLMREFLSIIKENGWLDITKDNASEYKSILNEALAKQYIKERKYSFGRGSYELDVFGYYFLENDSVESLKLNKQNQTIIIQGDNNQVQTNQSDGSDIVNKNTIKPQKIENSNISNYIWQIVIAIISTLIAAYIIYRLGWNS